MNETECQLIDLLLDGALPEEECANLLERVQDDPRMIAYLADRAILHCDLRQSLKRRQVQLLAVAEAAPQRTQSTARVWQWLSRSSVAAAVVVLLVGVAWLMVRTQVMLERGVGEGVRLTSASQARFFEESVPSIESKLEFKREYVLTRGMIELKFPMGATTIIESPAVFRIVSEGCLSMEAGRCSVYAPDGAEGFRVETPTTRVVDLGTRFMVSVAEDAATEVQMIEGSADVFLGSVAERTGIAPVQLRNQEAMRFAGTTESTASRIPSLPQSYRMNLPDRIVSYEAIGSESGRVEKLKSVSVQRGGQLQTVSVDDLIGIALTQFRSGGKLDDSGHLAYGSSLPIDRLALLADSNLNTGTINPGGNQVPLQSTPDADTPGFAVRFNTPVVNDPGPDVIFFELQCKANPMDGDAFHVSPIEFSRSSRSHTVRIYDLTLASREALPIAGFSLYRFPKPIDSIDDLRMMEGETTAMRTVFQALAVGIDLSDLGFSSGESVQELFFQDAADDESIVDPVFIAGLPSVTASLVEP